MTKETKIKVHNNKESVDKTTNVNSGNFENKRFSIKNNLPPKEILWKLILIFWVVFIGIGPILSVTFFSYEFMSPITSHLFYSGFITTIICWIVYLMLNFIYVFIWTLLFIGTTAFLLVAGLFLSVLVLSWMLPSLAIVCLGTLLISFIFSLLEPSLAFVIVTILIMITWALMFFIIPYWAYRTKTNQEDSKDFWLTSAFTSSIFTTMSTVVLFVFWYVALDGIAPGNLFFTIFFPFSVVATYVISTIGAFLVIDINKEYHFFY